MRVVNSVQLPVSTLTQKGDKWYAKCIVFKSRSGTGKDQYMVSR